MCMPIAYQNDIKGILYLENDLISGCFKPERVLVLNILASQLAISIQHSKHFESEMRALEQLAQVQHNRAEDEQSNRRKLEEFIDRICHEIRNPIQGILGNCEIIAHSLRELKSQSVNPISIDDLLSYVNNIEVCGKYQHAVTNDVLTLSKLELSKVLLDISPANVHQIIQSVYKMNSAKAVLKGVTLKYDLSGVPDKNMMVMIDSGRISMVLLNLVTNAIKFTASGDILISCFIKNQTDKDCELYFSVKDTGCGMEPYEMQHIFDRFAQATQRTYSEYGGSGLGLFISKVVVDLMGGSLGVESEKNIGSEFKFNIKCKIHVVEPIRKTSIAPSPSTSSSSSSSFVDKPQKPVFKKRGEGPLSVLIAEDNKINQRVILRMLQKCGCTCVVANDGAEALSLFRENGPFDVVFMDVVMPNMDGYESTSNIRQVEKSRGDGNRVLIVGLSGNVRQEYHELGSKAGMDLFYNKPVNQAEIHELIKSLIG
ncbi:hypothetical protein AKO1_013772 [Acrasis kona]|uniref:histidine kinase n=1 Tax=Acrasis kona TaxID=1008807 RepID=A0AAW2ZIQ9_9EUKA